MAHECEPLAELERDALTEIRNIGGHFAGKALHIFAVTNRLDLVRIVAGELFLFWSAPKSGVAVNIERRTLNDEIQSANLSLTEARLLGSWFERSPGQNPQHSDINAVHAAAECRI